MTDSAVIEAPSGAALAEQVVIKGDLSKLSELDRMSYYSAVCESLGLNPLTRPFEYINLNGKLTLYATRGCADQLRATRGITITGLDAKQVGDLYVVIATGRDRAGREDSSTGAVASAGLRGEALANAIMKAETKAKRRLTLSLAGLGMTDESEIDSIPDETRRVEQPATMSLAEKAAQKAQQLQAGGPATDVPVDQSHVGGTEAVVTPTADASTPAPAPAGPCPVRSPRGARCDRGAGHAGNHTRANVSWPTPEAAGAANDGAAPASLDSEPVVEGEFTESGSAVCDAVPPEGPLGMKSSCLEPAGHAGVHKSAEGSWPAA